MPQPGTGSDAAPADLGRRLLAEAVGTGLLAVGRHRLANHGQPAADHWRTTLRRALR